MTPKYLFPTLEVLKQVRGSLECWQEVVNIVLITALSDACGVLNGIFLQCGTRPENEKSAICSS